jgi:hypothetical protein
MLRLLSDKFCIADANLVRATLFIVDSCVLCRRSSAVLLDLTSPAGRRRRFAVGSAAGWSLRFEYEGLVKIDVREVASFIA